jgi:hypothetical protein
VYIDGDPAARRRLCSVRYDVHSPGAPLRTWINRAADERFAQAIPVDGAETTVTASVESGGKVVRELGPVTLAP